jgi:hypothetical protein
MPKPPFEEELDAPASETPRSVRAGRMGRGKAAGAGFFSSLIARAKAAPAPYWVVGLGAGALAVDYFIEGPNSIASSIYRGIFGPSREPGLPPAPPPAGPAAPRHMARVPQVPARVLAPTFAPTLAPVPYYLPPPVYYQAVPPVYRTPQTHRGWYPHRRGWRQPWFGSRTGYDWE